MLRAVIEASDYVVLRSEPAGLCRAPLIKTIQQLIAPSGRPYRVLINEVDPRSLNTAEEARHVLFLKDGSSFTVSVRITWPTGTRRPPARSSPSTAAIGTRLKPTPHVLRHTAASFAIDVGANVKVVQKTLGHRSAATQ